MALSSELGSAHAETVYDFALFWGKMTAGQKFYLLPLRATRGRSFFNPLRFREKNHQKIPSP